MHSCDIDISLLEVGRLVDMYEASARADTYKVYAVWTERHPNRIKIGYAKDWSRRFGNLQGDNSFKLKGKVLFRFASLKSARLVESFLHSKLRDYHIRNEWFLANFDEVKRIAYQVQMEIERRRHPSA